MAPKPPLITADVTGTGKPELGWDWSLDENEPIPETADSNRSEDRSDIPDADKT